MNKTHTCMQYTKLFEEVSFIEHPSLFIYFRMGIPRLTTYVTYETPWTSYIGRCPNCSSIWWRSLTSPPLPPWTVDSCVTWSTSKQHKMSTTC